MSWKVRQFSRYLTCQVSSGMFSSSQSGRRLTPFSKAKGVPNCNLCGQSGLIYLCFFMAQGLGEWKWPHNFPLSVLILNSLAQKQKKEQIFFSPLSIIFLILSWKPKKNMFWLYLQIYLIILECWTTFYLWKRPLIECLWAWSLLAFRDFLCGTPGTKGEPGQRCKPNARMAPPSGDSVPSRVFWHLFI